MATFEFKGKNIEIDDSLIEQAEDKLTYPESVDEKWIRRFIRIAEKNGLYVKNDWGLTAMYGIQIMLKGHNELLKAWKKKLSEEGSDFTAFFYNGKMFSIRSDLIEQHRIKTGVEITNEFMGEILEEAFTDEEFESLPVEDLEYAITEQIRSVLESNLPAIPTAFV